MTTDNTRYPSPAGGSRPTEPAIPWARQPSTSEPPVTTRTRRVVRALPEWEPLPPGEILVHRQRRP